MYNRLVNALEQRFKNKIYNIFKKQNKAITERFKALYIENKSKNNESDEEIRKKAEKMTDNIFKNDEGLQITFEELLPFYVNAGELGNEMFNNVHFTGEDGTLYNIIEDKYLLWLNDYGVKQVTRINKTTRELTKKIVTDGMLNGDTFGDIADNLVNNLEEYSKKRALTIAETEIHNSFMYSNNLTATESGFKYKKWISCRDASVRPNHKTYDSIGAIAITEEFAPNLMYAGDYRASAKEVVRCRCVMKYLLNKND